MSIIGVVIIGKWSLKAVVKRIAPAIRGQFEALNFHPNYKEGKLIDGKPQKLCYLRLSEQLDPVQVVEILNSFTGNADYRALGVSKAFIPDHIPDLPLAKKPALIPLKLQRKLRIQPAPDTPVQLIIKAHYEIICELQYKYTGLFNLSKKLNHQLLISLATVIFDRLRDLIENNQEEMCSFKLTKAYRKAHPHFADFQFILTNLHKIEDNMSKPRTQIMESELMKTSTTQFLVDNVPYSQLVTTCHKYADRIGPTLAEHVKRLHCETQPDDSEEEIARKKVRTELVKMAPYMSTIIRQVLLKTLVPMQPDYCQMKIYGDPFLSNKGTMMVFLKKYGVTKMKRSFTMYNLLLFSIPRTKLSEIMTMDGCVVGGSTLIIRTSDIPKFSARSTLMLKLKEYFGSDQNDEDYNKIMKSLTDTYTDWRD